MYISSFPISPDNVWESAIPGANSQLSSEGADERGKVLVISQHPKVEFLRRQISRTFTVDDFWYVFLYFWVYQED